MFCLYTPGGGGYGEEEEGEGGAKSESKRRRLNKTFPERGSVFEYRMAQEGVWKRRLDAFISIDGKINRKS